MSFLKQDRKGDPDTLSNRSFFFLNLSFFLVFSNIGFFYLYPLALDAMGIGKHPIGWVMGLFSISAVLSRPFMGKAAIRRGEYRVISFGLALILIASLSYNLTSSFGLAMLATRVIHGVGFSAFIAGAFSLTARRIPPLRRGAAFSLVGVSLMAAIATAPYLGEAVIRGHGFHTLYMFAAGTVILAWLAMIIGVDPGPPRSRKYEKAVRYLPLLRNRPFLFLLCSTLVFAHAQATVTTFLSLIAAQDLAPIGRFFFVSYSAAILILLILARILDRCEKPTLLLISYPILSLGIIITPDTIASGLFVIPAMMFGISIGALFAVHNTLTASHGTMEEKPAVMALFTGIYDTGFITGAVVSGWLAHQIGLDLLFISTGVFALLGLLIAEVIRTRSFYR